VALLPKYELCDSDTVFTHQPLPKPEAKGGTLTIEENERLLSDWFGAEVVLLSSGRAGISLYFQILGLERYSSNVVLPRFISPCVMDMVVQYAYPIERGTGDVTTVLYHQYGYPQTNRPKGQVLEDICHRFYEHSATGDRSWVGQVSVFSLPKFFGTAGMIGGLVTTNAVLANKIRKLRNSCPLAPLGTREWIRETYQKARSNPGNVNFSPFLKAAHSLVGEYVQPDLDDLNGFPATLEEIQLIGEYRRERIDRLIEGLGANAAPASFIEGVRNWLPFAFAYFGSGEPVQFSKADEALRNVGILAGVYNVDVNRNTSSPNYRLCLLLPCHQDIPLAEIDKMVYIIKEYGA